MQTIFIICHVGLHNQPIIIHLILKNVGDELRSPPNFVPVPVNNLILETNCGIPPPPPLRGGYAFTGVEYGDQVTYDCECGYDLHGDQVLTCETGEWGQTPCCRSK